MTQVHGRYTMMTPGMFPLSVAFPLPTFFARLETSVSKNKFHLDKIHLGQKVFHGQEQELNFPS
ncbi:MAG: hypothetical protein KGL67_02495 [Patescibacteria group bacterium]|nr:hypothetical protein [Patescibacteria group bacterium]